MAALPIIADLSMIAYLSFPSDENRLRPGGEPSRRACLAGSRRGYSRLAGTL
jgi:hypothetical protein